MRSLREFADDFLRGVVDVCLCWAERLAPAEDLLPNSDDNEPTYAEAQATRAEMRQTLFDRIAERMAEDLTDDAIAAHLDAWENAQ